MTTATMPSQAWPDRTTDTSFIGVQPMHDKQNGPIKIGDKAVVGGVEGVVTRVGGGDVVDLITYGPAGPRFLGNVARGPGPDQWLTPQDLELKRDKTPRELAAEAHARGERAPYPGLWVTYAYNAAQDANYSVDILPIRARIRDVHSMTDVIVDLFSAEPPEDPMEPDLPFRTGERSYHVLSVKPAIRTYGYPKAWDYADGDLIVRFGPFLRADLIPPYTCPICKKGTKTLTPVYLGVDPSTIRDNVADRADVSACPKCLEDVREFMGLPRVKHVVGSEGGSSGPAPASGKAAASSGDPPARVDGLGEP